MSPMQSTRYRWQCQHPTGFVCALRPCLRRHWRRRAVAQRSHGNASLRSMPIAPMPSTSLQEVIAESVEEEDVAIFHGAEIVVAPDRDDAAGVMTGRLSIDIKAGRDIGVVAEIDGRRTSRRREIETKARIGDGGSGNCLMRDQA